MAMFSVHYVNVVKSATWLSTEYQACIWTGWPGSSEIQIHTLCRSTLFVARYVLVKVELHVKQWQRLNIVHYV